MTLDAHDLLGLLRLEPTEQHLLTVNDFLDAYVEEWSGKSNPDVETGPIVNERMTSAGAPENTEPLAGAIPVSGSVPVADAPTPEPGMPDTPQPGNTGPVPA